MRAAVQELQPTQASQHLEGMEPTRWLHLAEPSGEIGPKTASPEHQPPNSLRDCLELDALTWCTEELEITLQMPEVSHEPEALSVYDFELGDEDRLEGSIPGLPGLPVEATPADKSHVSDEYFMIRNVEVDEPEKDIERDVEIPVNLEVAEKQVKAAQAPILAADIFNAFRETAPAKVAAVPIPLAMVEATFGVGDAKVEVEAITDDDLGLVADEPLKLTVELNGIVYEVESALPPNSSSVLKAQAEKSVARKIERLHTFADAVHSARKGKIDRTNPFARKMQRLVNMGKIEELKDTSVSIDKILGIERS